MIVFLCRPQLYLSVGIRSGVCTQTAVVGFQNNGTVKKAEIWTSVCLDRALSTLKLLQSVKNVCKCTSTWYQRMFCSGTWRRRVSFKSPSKSTISSLGQTWGVKKCDVVMEEVRRRKKRCQGQLLYNWTTHNCSSQRNQDLRLQCDTCPLQCKCGREGKRKDWSEWQEAGNMGATWCPVEIFQLPRSQEAFFRSNFWIYFLVFLFRNLKRHIY